MVLKVGIITGSESDHTIMQEAIKVLNEYGVSYELHTFSKQTIKEQLAEYSKDAYSRGIRVIIAGTRGDANFTNHVATYFNIPTVGVPCKSENSPNTVESVFSVLQQPNEHVVANVALDAAQNAGILTVQILALNDEPLQRKIIAFKENLKDKILKANQELSQSKFDYKTN